MFSAKIDIYFLFSTADLSCSEHLTVSFENTEVEAKITLGYADVLIRAIINLRRTRMSVDPGYYRFEANRMEAKYLGQLRAREKVREIYEFARERTSRGYSDRVYWSSLEKVTGCIFAYVRLA